MKVSKWTWLVLGIGIFAIGFGSLYTLHSRELTTQEAIGSNLAKAQAALPKLVSQREDLDKQLAEAETKLEAARASFPDSVESVDVDERLFELADDYDLEIISITSAAPKDEEVEDITYSVTRFKVSVEGKVVDILDYVDALTTGVDFTTANMEWVSMDIPEPLTEDEIEDENMDAEEIAEYEKASAEIQFVIYTL